MGELNDIPEEVEKAAFQQTIYNLVLYLPLAQMNIEDGTSISKIVETAKKNSTKYKMDIGVLTALEEALDPQTGHPELGYAVIDHLSFNIKRENPRYLKNAGKGKMKLMTNHKAFVGATFSYQPPEGENMGEYPTGTSLVCRGTPEKAWLDNADMVTICRGYFQQDKDHAWRGISPIDVAMLEYYKVLREELPYDVVGNLTVSGHSKGGHEAAVLKLLYPEDFKKCYMLDGPGISIKLWRESTWSTWTCSRYNRFRKVRDITKFYFILSNQFSSL